MHSHIYTHMHTHIHTNFPHCSVFLIVKFYYSYAIFASFLIQFYVPMDFLEPPLNKLMRMNKLQYYFPRHHNKIRVGVENCFRALLVMITG